MPRCSYCGDMYEFPRGLTLVLKDGTVKHLCTSKCRKNMKMNRRKTRWISKKKRTAKEEAMLETMEEETAHTISDSEVPADKKEE